EPENVALEKTVEILPRRRNLVSGEKFTHEARVGAAGEFQSLKPVPRPELGVEHFRESLHAGPARVHQRAVNVEQNQPDHAAQSRRSPHPTQSGKTSIPKTR